jgi:hypothetical protein
MSSVRNAFSPNVGGVVAEDDAELPVADVVEFVTDWVMGLSGS